MHYCLKRVVFPLLVSLLFLPSVSVAEIQSGQLAKITPEALGYVLNLRTATDFVETSTSSSVPTYILKDTIAAKELMNLGLKEYKQVSRGDFTTNPGLSGANLNTKFVQISSNYANDDGDCYAFVTALMQDPMSDSQNLFNPSTFTISPNTINSLQAGTLLLTINNSSGYVVVFLKKYGNHIWIIDQNGSQKVRNNTGKTQGVIEIRKIPFSDSSSTRDRSDFNNAYNYRTATKR